MDRDYAEPLDVPALAAEALMSVGHFQRSYKEAYGETPYAHLMTRRVERAAWLLRQGDLSVTDVCMQVGCTSLGSFSARFTQLMGETPSDYRARSHDERHADRDRDEQEVVDGRDGELPPGDINGIHAGLLGSR